MLQNKLDRYSLFTCFWFILFIWNHFVLVATLRLFVTKQSDVSRSSGSLHNELVTFQHYWGKWRWRRKLGLLTTGKMPTISSSSGGKMIKIYMAKINCVQEVLRLFPLPKIQTQTPATARHRGHTTWNRVRVMAQIWWL